jgi:TolA-binding protein
MPNIPAPEVPKTKNKSLGMILIGTIAVAAIAVAVFFMTKNSREYSKAQKLLADKKYTEAETIFNELGDYKDSSSVVTECEYQLGMKAFERKEYENALQVFEEIKDYKDSAEMVEQSTYEASVDGQFLRALSKGLIARWVKENENTIGGYEIEDA